MRATLIPSPSSPRVPGAGSAAGAAVRPTWILALPARPDDEDYRGAKEQKRFDLVQVELPAGPEDLRKFSTKRRPHQLTSLLKRFSSMIEMRWPRRMRRCAS